MTAPKHIRASDQNEFDTQGRKDFVVRKHGFSSQQIYSLCIAAVIIIAGVSFLVYNDALLGSVMCTLTGFVLLIFAKQIETRKKELLSTEFLNALFSSAIAAGHKFTMIVRQESGNIVYLNRGFQDMFPDMIDPPKRTLEALLSLYYVSDADRNSVLAAAKQSTASQVPLTIQAGADRKTHSIVMSMEPIARPAGFCLIRGKAKA